LEFLIPFILAASALQLPIELVFLHPDGFRLRQAAIGCGDGFRVLVALPVP